MADLDEIPRKKCITTNTSVNYWSRRYSIFSKFDEGIWLTDDAWFGVTPEPIANKIAEHIAEASPADRSILIDAFGGAGGNTIAFAKSGRWKQIYSIEKDPVVLKCAKHNAKIYGVAHLITWFEGDCFQVLKNELKDLAQTSVIFASPPWGGPQYRKKKVLDLRTMEPYSLDTLMKEYSLFTKEIVLFLPRTSNINQIAKYVPDGKKATVMHYCEEGLSKAMCVYYGAFKPL
ncbi:RNA methylase family protein [Penicillium taxi]|uniref:RNA methylase family protein n=1 Tax=Penicillium taxi TaxID=168475 RepID=UPI0025457454|nr:RNA methylase family protein [Penicillium taxi]KAJ5899231.1 RNA methylase family protein [Penicillium taxi]